MENFNKKSSVAQWMDGAVHGMLAVAISAAMLVAVGQMALAPALSASPAAQLAKAKAASEASQKLALAAKPGAGLQASR